MNFGADHYVPVLKAKRGEKKALRLVAPGLRPHITPLLEIVERKADKSVDVANHLQTAFKGLADSVRPYSRCFLDARELEPDGPPAASEVFRRAAQAGIVFTPVTGLSRSADVAAALRHRTNGIALRLTRVEFEAGTLGDDIRRFMSKRALAPGDTDLIVDLGPVDDMVAAGVRAFAKAFLAEVPHPERWRTLTISACAFPQSMRIVERNSHELMDRADWLAWRDGVYAGRGQLVRLPAFSDCAIQHPKGVEGFNPSLMQVSAAVRYTVPDKWLLIKGVSTSRDPAIDQFPKLAKTLVYGDLEHHFRGAGHCAGCSSIKNAADGADGFGSAEAWRRLGTIHHVTTVAREIQALPWP